jgi:two-component system chemotaxis response regulator CheY
MPIRILLVDDSSEFLEAAERFITADPELQIAGKARSGEEALEMIPAIGPDLILMDVAMPGMNGLAATRKIKSGPEPPAVIILTLYDNPEYRAVAVETGADGFVTKSDLTTQLLPLIRKRFPQFFSEGSRKETSMKHILIVDDSLTMRRMIRASVQLLPHVSVNEAGNGLEAIEKLALKPVDLMTLDLNMPDMHGMEVLRFLRSHQNYQNLPVIVLTTKGDEASRQAAIEAGATVYLTKPFDPRVLSKKVGEMLGVG